MRTRYTRTGRILRRLLRLVRPIPKSPDYSHETDICAVKLVPERKLMEAFCRALRELGNEASECLYVEFGVFNGTSLACMASAAAKSGHRTLQMVGIDSFKGLPSKVSGEDGGVWRPGQFACSREETLRCLAAKQVPPSSYSLLDGWYDEIDAGQIASALGGRRVAILMIDCDAYSSAKRALALIEPHLTRRAVVFFDDWRLNDLDVLEGGEYRAFNEWRTANPRTKVESFPRYNRKSEAFILTAPDD